MGLKFLDLPAELIVSIAERLDVTDALRLRETCRTLADICVFPIRDRRRTLYLHPKSIGYAIRLCFGTEWTGEITELVLLGSSDPEMKTREPSHLPSVKLDYHPWSQFPPDGHQERELSYQRLAQTEFNTFDHNYTPLLQGLHSLPNLRTIRYAASATQPGFCSVSDSTILNHAKSRDHWETSFGNEGQPKMHWAPRTVWWSDADVFTSLLSTLSDKLEKMELLQPMPAVKRHRQRDIRGAPVMRQEQLFRPQRGERLTSVKLTFHGPHGWMSFVEKVLSEMQHIKELEIEIKSQVDEESMLYLQNDPAAGQSILWEEDNARDRINLEHFFKAANLEKLTVNANAKYPYSIRDVDAIGFFRAQQQTLRHINFTNIVFYTLLDGDLATGLWRNFELEQGMYDVIQCLKEELQLESISLSVPKLGCVDSCVGTEHSRACCMYPVGEDFAKLEVLEGVAQRLGIQERDHSWEFGGAVKLAG